MTTKELIIAFILTVAGAIGTMIFGLAFTVNQWQNPDMTTLRLILTYPYSMIGMLICGIISCGGALWIHLREKGRKR